MPPSSRVRSLYSVPTSVPVSGPSHRGTVLANLPDAGNRFVGPRSRWAGLLSVLSFRGVQRASTEKTGLPCPWTITRHASPEDPGSLSSLHTCTYTHRYPAWVVSSRGHLKGRRPHPRRLSPWISPVRSSIIFTPRGLSTHSIPFPPLTPFDLTSTVLSFSGSYLSRRVKNPFSTFNPQKDSRED